jgi:hypothetical protein
MKVSDQLHIPVALPPGKEPHVPMGSSAGLEHCGVEENLFPPTRINY